MINRTWIKCLACEQPITARIQVGHDVEQPMSFPCPHCQTEVRLTFILDEPPNVKIRWDENSEAGSQEGLIVNIGVGFTIKKEKLHEDMYFPAFDAPRPDFGSLALPVGGQGPILLDIAIAQGLMPNAAETWRIVQRAWQFHRTNQVSNLNSQLDKYWNAPRAVDENLDNSIYSFLMRFMEPSAKSWLDPLESLLVAVKSKSLTEYSRLISYYDSELKQERFSSYVEIFSEYFRSYNEFNQTLVYARRELPLPQDAVATSSDFERTRMFYGNAFEALGTHLDIPAALNNIICGRDFDQMINMNLKQYRSINKANRPNCFAANKEISWLVAEYDSTIRNASHHRWFKLDDRRSQINYRSGGSGAIHQMSYAEYLLRCNRLVVRIMILACWELAMLYSVGKKL